jgi:hypothetical protein
MLNRIIAAFTRPRITPITLKRKSRIPVVMLRQSCLKTTQSRPVFGRMA